MVDFKDALKKAAEEYGIALSAAQIRKYEAYYSLLIEWNEKINLTAITEPEQVAVKHMIDSLSCWDEKIFTENASVIDVGTGAGFPGLPLKIWQPSLSLTLMDSLNKRIKFLQTVADSLELGGVASVHARAEEAAKNKIYRAAYDIAVSRAVARLNILAEYCLPFVKTGGWFVALKGSKYQEEADEAERAVKILGGRIEKIVPIKLPRLDDGRAVIYVRKIKDTPKSYPRKAGTPEKNPLF
jgi:16S rRNA (guanine527-N7)-methyltransferase